MVALGKVRANQRAALRGSLRRDKVYGTKYPPPAVRAPVRQDLLDGGVPAYACGVFGPV